jgi:transposase
MRRSFDALALAVRERLALDPESGALFVFASRRGNRLKVLWFDHNGYCLLYKRLHQALFELPVADAADRSLASIDPRTLAMILRGVAKCSRFAFRVDPRLRIDHEGRVTDVEQIAARLDVLEKRVAVAEQEREAYRKLYIETMERCRKLELGLLASKSEHLPDPGPQLSLDVLSMVLDERKRAELEAALAAPTPSKRFRRTHAASPPGESPCPSTCRASRSWCCPPKSRSKGATPSTASARTCARPSSAGPPRSSWRASLKKQAAQEHEVLLDADHDGAVEPGPTWAAPSPPSTHLGNEPVTVGPKNHDPHRLLGGQELRLRRKRDCQADPLGWRLPMPCCIERKVEIR